MAFIIALGIIIVLLCSASVFKLIQPKTSDSRKPSPKKIRNEPIASASYKVAKPKYEVAKEEAVVEEENFIEDEVIPVIKPSAPLKSSVSSVQIPDVISINLRASPDKPYAGYELLQALLSAGMRFSNTGLFYRHEKKTGTGPVLFSLASCTKEGTFDLSAIGGFSCKGLILFMKPKEVQDSVKVFELMLETADQLIHDLDGDVLNDGQQLLKKEDVLAIHEKLQRYTHACQTIA